jgi:hypothetical protein
MLGTAASTCYTRLIHASYTKHHEIVMRVAEKASSTTLVAALSTDLLRIFDADFGLLAILNLSIASS